MDPEQVRLTESEALFCQVLENLPNPVACIRAGPEARVVYVSARFVEAFGYTLEDVPTLDDWVARACPDDPNRTTGYEEWKSATDPLWRTPGTIDPQELRITCKDGKNLHILVGASRVENLQVVTFLDITPSRRMAEGLRAAKEDLEATLAALPDLLFKVDPEGHILEYHSALGDRLYTPASVFLGKRYQEFLPEPASEAIRAALREARDAGRHHGGTYSLPMPSGECWYELSASSMGKPGEAEADVVCLVRDITERVLLEQKLRQSEERYRNLADNITDVVWILDLDEMRFTYMSPSVVHQVGLTPEEAIARGVQGGLTPASQKLVQEAIAWGFERFSRGERLVFRTLEVDQYHKDGTLVPSEVTVRLLPSPDGLPHQALGMTRDIRERRAAERRQAEQDLQLQEARKLEAVGILAGGVAHHYNNILASILGFTELLMREPNLVGTPALQDLQVIKGEAQRAADLTWKLLALSERQLTWPEALCLSDAVSQAAPGLLDLLGDRVNLVLALDPEAGQVSIDLNHLGRVLEHLATNARDAMPEGGSFTLETANLELGGKAAEALRVPPGAYVVLSATDTGSGMDQATQAHLFEPFFTTKGHGKGTGLGLSVVRGIARRSGGGIAVESERGRGTAVRLYLPRVGTPAS